MAIRRARALGQNTLALVNVPESTIARESDGVLLTRAGPEFGVASTKATTAQLTAFCALAIALGCKHGRRSEERSGGKAGVSPSRYRGAPYHEKKKKTNK